MPHYLFRPHVRGPKSNVTTPDILLERLLLVLDGERCYAPIHRLSANVELQALPGTLEITPAYAIVAAGGGPLLTVAVLVRHAGEAAAKADFVIARSAWRLRNVIDQFGTLRLHLSEAAQTEPAALSAFTPPAEFLAADAGDLTLPRGVIALCASSQGAVIPGSPALISVGLSDQGGRRLIHTVRLDSVNSDHWEKRPFPRYTVGPVGPVEHYI